MHFFLPILRLSLSDCCGPERIEREADVERPKRGLFSKVATMTVFKVAMLAVFLAAVEASPDARRLYDDLLANYNK